MPVTAADDFAIQLALRKGVLREEQVAAARSVIDGHADAATPAPQLADVLATHGAIEPRRLAELVAAEFGLETVELDSRPIPSELLRLVPRAFAMRHRLLPLSRAGRALRVAVADPLDSDGIDSLAHLLGLTVEPVLVLADELTRALERCYGREEASLDALLSTLSAREPAGAATSPAEVASAAVAVGESDAPVIQLVHAIILEAIRRRASDIHLEPLEKRFRVRYRIDGVLLEAENPPKRLQLAIVSRLKIMANISIAEKRVPQDGRIQLALGGRSLDLRVSSLPTAHGESIVMRLLDKESLQPGLPELGFFRDDQALFERLVALPDGIVLVTWDMPNRSMNVINLTIIEELSAIVEKVAADAAIKGAVITSGKESFCAGADLALLESLTRAFADMAKSQGEEAASAILFNESRKLSQLYRRIETCGKPFVAAINGTALGLLNLNWDFRGPIRLGDTIHARVTTDATRRTKAGDGIVTLRFAVVNQKGETVQEGTATLLMKAAAAG